MSDKEILVFTAGFCPSCPNWKQMLDSKGVEYKTIDIEEVFKWGGE